MRFVIDFEDEEMSKTPYEVFDLSVNLVGVDDSPNRKTSHGENLYKHIMRQSKKYEDVPYKLIILKDQCDEDGQRLRSLSKEGRLYHIHVQLKIHEDVEGIYQQQSSPHLDQVYLTIFEKYHKLLEVEGLNGVIQVATIAGGSNGNQGGDIYPILHIIVALPPGQTILEDINGEQETTEEIQYDVQKISNVATLFFIEFLSERFLKFDKSMNMLHWDGTRESNRGVV